MSKKIILASFVLLNIVAFGWMFAIPIMVFHIESIFSYKEFFLFVLISTISGIVSVIKLGFWIDKYGVKPVLITGLILNFIFWIILSSASNFYFLLIAFIIEGVSVSAILISRSVYVYEITKSRIDSTEYKDVESFIKTIMLFISVGILIIAGYLYEIKNSLPFIINSVIVLMSLISIILIKNKFKHKEYVEKLENSNFYKKLKEFKSKNKNLYYLSTSEGIFTGLSAYIYFFVSMVLIENGATPLFLSYLIALIYISRAFGSYLISINKSTRMMYLFSIFLISTLFSFYFLKENLIISFMFIVISFMKEYIELYLTVTVTEKSQSSDRGFVRSYLELISNIVIISLMLISYFFLDYFNVNGLMVLYSTLFLLSFYYIGAYCKSKKALY